MDIERRKVFEEKLKLCHTLRDSVKTRHRECGRNENVICYPDSWTDQNNLMFHIKEVDTGHMILTITLETED